VSWSAGPAPEGAVSASWGQLRDADLIHRHLNGDPVAFSVLFSRHKHELWAVAIRLLGDVGQATDAMQHAMILAFRKAHDFASGEAVSTWLYRMVVNVCLDRMQRAPELAADGDVLAAMRHLGLEQQSALVLVDMLGFSHADASNILGVSEDTLRWRCATGRMRLLAELTHG
jgi:RNA polymerase sigma-70 factor, ECF subfamily